MVHRPVRVRIFHIFFFTYIPIHIMFGNHGTKTNYRLLQNCNLPVSILFRYTQRCSSVELKRIREMKVKKLKKIEG